MTAIRAALWCGVATVFAAHAEARDVKLHLPVPASVAEDAEARASGDASAAPPILKLDGLEVGAGEGLTIEVRSTPAGAILGEAGFVGQPQKTLAPPVQKFDLVIPLNAKGSELLAGKREVDIVLHVEDSDRPPLQFDRAYFSVER